jgi:RNA polymerase sigma-70 factor (ECF subfamily)
MDRYALGDDGAFAELYDLIAPKLLAFLSRQTGQRARAEDLVQQTFLQMHCARDTYVTGADVVPWAFAIARRLAIDAYRKNKREVQGDALSLAQAADVLGTTVTAVKVRAHRTYEALRGALRDDMVEKSSTR